MELSRFSNKQVEIDLLPGIGDLEYSSLHKDYLTAEIISLSIFWLIFASGAIVFLILNPAKFPFWLQCLISSFLFGLISLSYTITIVGFKRKKYALREHDIVYKHGLIWRSEIVIPFSRIQHAEVRQGPIERLFKLSKLNIFTAGGGSSDLSISGLEIHTSEAMKNFLLKKSADEEE